MNRRDAHSAAQPGDLAHNNTTVKFSLIPIGSQMLCRIFAFVTMASCAKTQPNGISGALILSEGFTIIDSGICRSGLPSQT